MIVPSTADILVRSGGRLEHSPQRCSMILPSFGLPTWVGNIDIEKQEVIQQCWLSVGAKFERSDLPRLGFLIVPPRLVLSRRLVFLLPRVSIGHFL